jgi:hypothetical protein
MAEIREKPVELINETVVWKLNVDLSKPLEEQKPVRVIECHYQRTFKLGDFQPETIFQRALMNEGDKEDEDPIVVLKTLRENATKSSILYQRALKEKAKEKEGEAKNE